MTAIPSAEHTSPALFVDINLQPLGRFSKPGRKADIGYLG
jgi:hypothetical protein